MAGHRLDLSIEKGSSWINTIELSDADGVVRDLSGYTAGMMIRPTRTSSKTYQYLSTDNGYIIIQGTLGRVCFYLDPDQTATIGNTPHSVTGEYDLELYGPTNTTVVGLPTLGTERIIYGTILFVDEVTR